MKKNILFVVMLFVVQVVSAQSNNSEDSVEYSLEEVDVRPEFPGGFNDFMKYIGKTFVMPDYEGVGGVLRLSFVVEKDGSLSNVKVLHELDDKRLSKEATRVVLASPSWNPGELMGKKVRVVFILPMQFQNKAY